MSDRVFFPCAVLCAIVLIALAAVWPQGLGLRSPWPFGGPPVMQSPAMRAALAREAAAKPKLVKPTAVQAAGLRPHQ